MNTIIELQKEKQILLSLFNDMASKHKKLYSNIDISLPKSEAEKTSEADKNIIACKLNNIIIQINKLKKAESLQSKML